MQTQTEAESDDKDIYVIAASDNEKTSAIITYYTFDDNKTGKKVTLDILDTDKKFNAYLLDTDNDITFIGEVYARSEFILSPNSVVFLEEK